jgi:hypothetical protein
MIEIAKIAYEDSNQEFAKNRSLSEALHEAPADRSRK